MPEALYAREERWDKQETQEYMWHFDALDSTSLTSVALAPDFVAICRESRGKENSLKWSVGESKFEIKVSNLCQDLVRRRSHAKGTMPTGCPSQAAPVKTVTRPKLIELQWFGQSVTFALRGYTPKAKQLKIDRLVARGLGADQKTSTFQSVIRMIEPLTRHVRVNGLHKHPQTVHMAWNR